MYITKYISEYNINNIISDQYNINKRLIHYSGLVIYTVLHNNIIKLYNIISTFPLIYNIDIFETISNKYITNNISIIETPEIVPILNNLKQYVIESDPDITTIVDISCNSILYNDNIIYYGKHNNYMKIGFGALKYKDEYIFIGYWKVNKKDGYGIYINLKNKSNSYYGRWENNNLIENTMTIIDANKTQETEIGILSMEEFLNIIVFNDRNIGVLLCNVIDMSVSKSISIYNGNIIYDSNISYYQDLNSYISYLNYENIENYLECDILNTLQIINTNNCFNFSSINYNPIYNTTVKNILIKYIGDHGYSFQITMNDYNVILFEYINNVFRGDYISTMVKTYISDTIIEFRDIYNKIIITNNCINISNSLIFIFSDETPYLIDGYYNKINKTIDGVYINFLADIKTGKYLNGIIK